MRLDFSFSYNRSLNVFFLIFDQILNNNFNKKRLSIFDFVIKWLKINIGNKEEEEEKNSTKNHIKNIYSFT